VEKSKIDFPTSLGNPANTRGIPTFPTASAAAVYKTNSCRTDGDISNEVRLGTFLSSYDKLPPHHLTRRLAETTLRGSRVWKQENLQEEDLESSEENDQ